MTARRLSTEKSVPNRSAESRRHQGIHFVDRQDIGSTNKAPEEDKDSMILTQDDDNNLHVFSIRLLPSRRPSLSKRNDEQSYLRKQQLKARVLVCFEYFDPHTYTQAVRTRRLIAHQNPIAGLKGTSRH